MKFIYNLILFTCICTIALTISSCNKETVVETKTITEIITDTIFLTEETDVTTFILVRHAEKSSVGNDPDLTEEGVARAAKLALILSEIEIDRVYSTNFNRTTQTAMPTADSKALTISNYEGFDHEVVIDDVLETANEGKILIVGHSNTTPNFLNTLTGTTNYPDLADDEYDNLFIVNTKSKGDSEVIHLKY